MLFASRKHTHQTGSHWSEKHFELVVMGLRTNDNDRNDADDADDGHGHCDWLQGGEFDDHDSDVSARRVGVEQLGGAAARAPVASNSLSLSCLGAPHQTD